jgi:hypothetical protein
MIANHGLLVERCVCVKGLRGTDVSRETRLTYRRVSAFFSLEPYRAVIARLVRAIQQTPTGVYWIARSSRVKPGNDTEILRETHLMTWGSRLEHMGKEPNDNAILLTKTIHSSFSRQRNPTVTLDRSTWSGKWRLLPPP